MIMKKTEVETKLQMQDNQTIDEMVRTIETIDNNQTSVRE